MSVDRGTLDWQARAITLWPGPKTSPRIGHPFHSTSENGYRSSKVDWIGTLAILKRELNALGAKKVVLELAVRPSQIRRDGWVRGDASIEDPGVILSFDSDIGPMRYPVDRYTSWQGNVRALALALEALRKVNRYGVAGRAEQYRGWLAIPAQTGGVDPHQLIAKWAEWTEEAVRAEPLRALRIAKRAAHPDTFEGREDVFRAVVRAGEVLGA